MRQAPLEERSITELRALAQAMGADYNFGMDCDALRQSIRDHMEAQVPKPRIPDDLRPTDIRVATDLSDIVVTQVDVAEACLNSIDRGMRLTFPTPDTWMMEYGKKQDSGTLRMPLVDVVRCARELMK